MIQFLLTQIGKLKALVSGINSKTNVSAIKYPTVNLNRCTVYRGGLHKIGNAVFLSCVISSQHSATNSPKMLTLPDDCKPVAYTSISVAEAANGDGANIENVRTGFVDPDGGLYINTTENGKSYYLAGAWVNL